MRINEKHMVGARDAVTSSGSSLYYEENEMAHKIGA